MPVQEGIVGPIPEAQEPEEYDKLRRRGLLRRRGGAPDGPRRPSVIAADRSLFATAVAFGPVIRRLSYLLALVGLVFVVVGVIYLVTPARSLPGFIPGHVAHLSGHRYKRGTASLVVGFLCWGGAGFGAFSAISRDG